MSASTWGGWPKRQRSCCNQGTNGTTWCFTITRVSLAVGLGSGIGGHFAAVRVCMVEVACQISWRYLHECNKKPESFEAMLVRRPVGRRLSGVACHLHIACACYFPAALSHKICTTGRVFTLLLVVSGGPGWCIFSAGTGALNGGGATHRPMHSLSWSLFLSG